MKENKTAYAKCAPEMQLFELVGFTNRATIEIILTYFNCPFEQFTFRPYLCSPPIYPIRLASANLSIYLHNNI